MQAMWRLRMRTDKAQKQLTEVNPDEPVSKLFKRVAEIMAVPVDAISILAGVPPKPLVNSDEALSTTHIINCDTLVVRDTSIMAHRPPIRRRKSSSDEPPTSLLEVAATAAEQHMDAADGIDRLGNVLIQATDPKIEANAIMMPLRKKMTSELRVREQERLAQYRLQAALANDFEMAQSKTQTLSARTSALDVTFKIGPRKTFTEQFTPFPPTLLRMVVSGLAKDPDARENLRNFNMALMSPRVFWNIVRFMQGGDPEEGLMELCPDTDWSFLEVRRRELSEKALHNQRQAAMEAKEQAELKQQREMAKQLREERRKVRQAAKRKKDHDGGNDDNEPEDGDETSSKQRKH
eukprot:TRINITY_DN12578_c0_g8_i2.p1 TRINITY_DN12578_c0_g8~~TRINITY_DN12578_c0_g8_i2.p1  ORF type:complete len:350 (+),score=85.39 TRINITY_DN12578_c0_g8_i2:74-1123(+)